MFDRIERLIGKEKVELLKNATVLVVGLGGVGGSCVESLVRSGIGNLIIVDFDVIDSSNINRQVISFSDNIGQKKVIETERLVKRINPDCNVISYDLFLDDSNIDRILTLNIDFVVDACDSVKTKQSIIKKCIDKKIKFISCMGTGNKIEPEKLEITDIRETQNDPLARVMRKWAKDNNIKEKIPVVSSQEVPLKKDAKILSMCFVPNVAGVMLASYVVRDIISKGDNIN